MEIELSRLTGDVSLDGIESRPMAELRSMRDHLQEVEDGLSYVRRLIQGRLDIVTLELDRRARGADPSSRLIDELPSVLAQHTRGGGLPRPTRDLMPPALVEELTSQLDSVLAPSQLADLDNLDIEHLRGAGDQLTEAEQAVSGARRELHRMIDVIQEELIGRYRNGSASVDDLLV